MTTTFRPEPGQLPERDAVPTEYRWDLTSICASWDDWSAGYSQLDAAIAAFKTRQGTLGSSALSLLEAFQAMDQMGALAYRGVRALCSSRIHLRRSGASDRHS